MRKINSHVSRIIKSLLELRRPQFFPFFKGTIRFLFGEVLSLRTNKIQCKFRIKYTIKNKIQRRNFELEIQGWSQTYDRSFTYISIQPGTNFSLHPVSQRETCIVATSPAVSTMFTCKYWKCNWRSSGGIKTSSRLARQHIQVWNHRSWWNLA